MARSRNMTRASPAELLFNSYRRQVLALLLLRSDESYHVREIARLTGAPPGSLHRELKLLSEAGFLLRNTVGNQVHYRANRDFLIFEELASIFRKTIGLADVLREALKPLNVAPARKVMYNKTCCQRTEVTR